MSRTNARKQMLDKIPGPDLPPRKSERTREAILDSALQFLWKSPFRDLTVGELMSATGSSRSTFYQYFKDLHELMEALLRGLNQEIFEVARPWFEGEGDPVPLLKESLAGLVKVCHEQGPIIRAVVEAAPMDGRLEQAWSNFIKSFDDAVAERITEHQAAGHIAVFDARLVAIALNRMDVGVMIQHFGRLPRSNPNQVCDSITQIWVSTLYGIKALSRIDKSLVPPECLECECPRREKGQP